MIVKRRAKDGSIRYGVRSSRDGERHWLGTFDKLGEARAAESKFLAAGRDPSRGPTCGEFARQWLAQDCPRTSGRKLKSETISAYEYRLRAFRRDFDTTPITDVPRDRAFQWALKHRHDVSAVTALFSHARDLALIASNPFAGLGLRKGQGRKNESPLTETQLYELADGVYNVEDATAEWRLYAPQFRAFILFQAYSGLRPGETFALEWSNRAVPEGEPPMSYIDGDRIHVERRLGRRGTIDVPKSGHGRVVLLPPPAREALASFPRSLGLVFRGPRGGRLSTPTSGGFFKRTREAAGMPDVQVYSLRHFAAHHMYVRMGLPARVVAAQLGHSDGGRLVEGLYGHGSHGAIEELERAWQGRTAVAFQPGMASTGKTATW